MIVCLKFSARIFDEFIDDYKINLIITGIFNRQNISIYYTPIHYGLSIISQLLLYLQLILVAVNITSHILPHFTIRI